MAVATEFDLQTAPTLSLSLTQVDTRAHTAGRCLRPGNGRLRYDIRFALQLFLSHVEDQRIDKFVSRTRLIRSGILTNCDVVCRIREHQQLTVHTTGSDM